MVEFLLLGWQPLQALEATLAVAMVALILAPRELTGNGHRSGAARA